MENINFICCKTPDGRKITLDGFRVESSTWTEDDRGNKCNDLIFKSGQEIRVLADSFDGDIDAHLWDCMRADKNTNYANQQQRSGPGRVAFRLRPDDCGI